jgi:5'(3')-deoxyribonucleotidase
MLVYVDMDNTLIDTMNGSLAYAEKFLDDALPRFNQINVEDDRCTSWFEKAGYSLIEASEIRLRLYHDVYFWETLPLKEGAYEVFKWLYENHETYIATSAFKSNAEECYVGKIRWIKRNLPWFPVDRVIYSHMKYNLVGDILIEDIVSQIIKFNGYKILIDAGWNRQYKGKDKFYRASNWNNIKHFIEGLER